MVEIYQGKYELFQSENQELLLKNKLSNIILNKFMVKSSKNQNDCFCFDYFVEIYERLSSLKIHSILQQFQARWAKGCQQSCCESRKKMSIFESVIAKFNQALSTPSWQKKLAQICSPTEESLVIFKDKNEILNVKGPFHVLLTEKSALLKEQGPPLI